MTLPFSQFDVDKISEGLPYLNQDIIDRIVPLHEDKGIAFDEIRIEIWSDSGRLIAFPAMKNFKERTEITGCQIISSDLLSRTTNLMDSDISDNEFEEKHNEIIDEVIDTIIEGLSLHPNLKYAIYDSEGESLGESSYKNQA